jgi:hypothetical protein
MSIRSIGGTGLVLLSLLLVAANAAEYSAPKRCSWRGNTYGVGDVIVIADKVFQCETVYADNMKALYYWIRLVEQEQRMRLVRRGVSRR